MKKFTMYAVASVGALILLAACGGGGGDAPAATSVADATDKYIGSWGNCAPVIGATNGVLSARADFVFTKNSATSLAFTVNGTGFSLANCAGTALNSSAGLAKGTYTLNGTKKIGSDTVDLINILSTSTGITALNGSFKDIGLVNSTTYTPGAASAADAQGYPTVLDTATVFKKL